MAITAATEKEYSTAIRYLFPQGEYWDRQFSDPESDINLFCKAKTKEIINFRHRMRDLFLEGDFQTAMETIDDWERVLLDYINIQLPIRDRQTILSIKTESAFNRIVIANIAQKHGLKLADIVFPFKPSFFGFSQFGKSIFSRPVFFSVFYIILTFNSDTLINEAKKRITQLFRNSSFGISCFGTGQFLGHSYFNKDYISRIFKGMKPLNDFENEINSISIAANIIYFTYKLEED